MNLRLKRARELAGYAVQLTKDEGLPTMLKRGAGFVKRRCFGKRARYLPAKKVLEAQRAEMAGKTADTCGLPTISILTPLYNTPEKYLREFLDSFVGQTAPNGQLCLADASDAQHGDVQRIVEEYQAKNQRIVYKKIENKGIAANTNAAAQLATGEYLALADHDDILAPHAMYTMGQAILQLRQQGEPDGFVYSDEALFSKSIRRPIAAHFKPDYAPDYLLCCNYICHLAVFKKALWDAVGGERPECDGSQDHDLFLRLLERTGGAAGAPGLDPAFRHGVACGQLFQLLESVFHVHGLGHTVADGGLEGLLDLMLDDKDHGLEACAAGVVERIIHDDLPVGAHRVDLLHAAVTAAHAGRHHDQYRFVHNNFLLCFANTACAVGIPRFYYTPFALPEQVQRGRRRPFCGAAHSFASVNFQNMQFILVKVLFLASLSCILASLSASFTCQFPVLLVKKHFPIIKKEGYSHE